MEYKLNPFPIFEDYVHITNKYSLKNKHKLNNEFKEISYEVANDNYPYYDHIETSGLFSSLILSYGVDESKNFIHSYHIVFPTFRRKIDDTRGSFACRIKKPLEILINGKSETENLKNVLLNGLININTITESISITRKFLCTSFPGVLTIFSIKNKSNENKVIEICCPIESIKCDENDFSGNPYHIEFNVFKNHKEEDSKYIKKILKPGHSLLFYFVISCQNNETNNDNIRYDTTHSLSKRISFLFNSHNSYSLKIGNPILESMLYFSKVRALESIFLTKSGLLHSPGGGNYYAAVWCNDQCEYAAPFFAYCNNKKSKEASLNCFRLYTKYMYTSTALVSSIVAQGDDYWNGAKDRGDGAMYVYGLTRFLLSSGSKKMAKEFINPIKWCIDFTLSRKNEFGVIESDSDELENRFESGNCNLATNSIFYQALIKTNLLFNELNIKNNYDEIAKELKENIIKYFYNGKEYIYCKEETHKRSHIVYPLIMGIYDHSDSIINTIMSKELFTGSDFKTIDNCDTYWDRVTLMAIRGIFNANNPNLAYDILLKYSEKRLLNNHVPYAIEAFPEGNQAHLSAESALYARIYLEGILGFEPIGFNCFKLHISIPDKVKYISLKNIYYNGRSFSISVHRVDKQFKVIITALSFKVIMNNFEDVIVNIKSKKR